MHIHRLHGYFFSLISGSPVRGFEQIFLLMCIIIIMDIWFCMYGHVTLKSQLMN